MAVNKNDLQSSADEPRGDQRQAIHFGVTDSDSTGAAVFLDTLCSITHKLVSTHDLLAMLSHIVDELHTLFDADCVYVSLPDSNDRAVVPIARSGALIEEYSSVSTSDTVIGRCWKTGETVYRNRFLSETDDLILNERHSQAVAIPIKVNQKMHGVLSICFSDICYFLERKIDVLEQVAQLAAVAISNAMLVDESSAELERTNAISKLSQLMQAELSIETLLDEVCKIAIAHSSVTQASILRLEDARLPPISRWWSVTDGADDVALRVTEDTHHYNSIMAWCIKHRKPIVLDQGIKNFYESDSDYQFRKLNERTCVSCIPLLHNDSCWGIQVVRGYEGQKMFDQKTLIMLAVVAGQTAVAIHRHILLQEIEFQAYHDAVTRLPNRRQFEESLANTIEYNKAGEYTGVIRCELDGLKTIIDSQGHGVGDILLVLVGERFAKQIRDGDLLAKMTGDEFAVIANNMSSGQDDLIVCNRLADALLDDFIVDGQSYRLSASFGLSMYPTDTSCPRELVRNSGVAMRQSKIQGLNQIQRYSDKRCENYERSIQMEIELSHALARGEFEVFYQPKVSTKSGKVFGVEALVRWNHPQRGLISPTDFIAIAEKTRLITSIGDWVLDEACRQTAAWHAEGEKLHVAVNISSQQFQLDSFVEKVLTCLNRYKLHPNYLELEVTESIVMKDMDAVITKLKELQWMGIEISVDDFGTGYSSLRYLQDLPLGTLKIDRAFVTQLDYCESHKSLVNTIVIMAKSFGLTTVAEGVETREQLLKVTDLGCEYIQGFYYSRPVKADQVLEVVARIEDEIAEQQSPVEQIIPLAAAG